MKSLIRIDFDEDKEVLKSVTLGPALKAYVETLDSVSMFDFVSSVVSSVDSCLWNIWDRNVAFNKYLEGDDN